MRFLLTFPFQILFRCGEAGLRIMGFTFGFCFRLLRFMTSHFFVLLIGALVGVLLGRGHFGKRLSGKRG